MLRRRTATADHASNDDPSRRDRGVTFVELLVSVVLLGTAGIAVLAATTAAIMGAQVSDEIAKAQQSLAEAANYLMDTEPENVAYEPCDGDPLGVYQAALDGRFGAGEIEVVSVTSWEESSLQLIGCDPEFRLQLVELRVAAGDGSRSVEVVKRPAAIPTVGVGDAEDPPEYVPGSGNADVSLTPWL